MTGLYIAVAVIFALLLFGQIRAGIVLEYLTKQLVVRVRFGCVSVPVYPPRDRRETKSKKTKGSPGKKRSLSALKPFLPCALRAVKRILRSLRIDDLDLSIRVGGPDPADSAMRYGRLNAAIGSVWGPLNSMVEVKNAGIHLDVDFDAEHSDAHGSMAISWKLSQLVSAVVAFVRDAIVVALKNSSANKQEGLVT